MSEIFDPLKQALTSDVAVVGAGILGLATAYVAARAGLGVAVFERNPVPQGASLRNFGLVWPVGMPHDSLLALALRSRDLWLQVLKESGLDSRQTGSLHAAYREDEAAVAKEFAAAASSVGYPCAWLPPRQTLARSRALKTEGLLGALWSTTELSVDSRQVLRDFPRFLSDRYGVRFFFNTPVLHVESNRLVTPEHSCKSKCIVVAAGDEFQSLCPEFFRQSGVTRCKLQMMRTVVQPGGWLLGPSLAFAPSFLHYAAFAGCPSLPALRRRLEQEQPEILRYGIHLLVSQTTAGGLTLGDSHEYSLVVDIFDKPAIHDAILGLARQYLAVPTLEIAEQWHGVYASHPQHPWLTHAPAAGVRVLTVTRGIGMTLSFALAEQTLFEMGVSLETAQSIHSAANHTG